MTTYYSSDTPVLNKEQDSFSRWQFSERIAQVISRRTDPSSIVIGLYGKWGDGKTSVLNFIEKALENDENVICIKFNPWRFGTEEQLLMGFFSDIADALDAKIHTREDKLKDTAKKIFPSLTSMAGSEELGNIMTSFISTPDINEFKKRTEQILESSNKRVLIQIDDVDRLDKSEIHALFRLVKLTADFKHTAYILAFDKNIVASSLQDRYSSAQGNSGEAFLEKIIQIPLHLPKAENSVLRQLCFDGINEALRIAEISLTENQVNEFVHKFNLAFDSSLTTPRKAKLYGNILMFSLPILKGEVNVIDFMLIEGIRIFCPNLYNLLRNNKLLFSDTFNSSRYANNDDEISLIKELVETVLDKTQNTEKENYIKLLTSLFPKLETVYGRSNYGSNWMKSWTEAQKVCASQYYDRYFTYSIPSGDVSDILIRDLINNLNDWDKNIDSNPLDFILTVDNAEVFIRKIRAKENTFNANISSKLAIAISFKSDLLPKVESAMWTDTFSQSAILVNALLMNIDSSHEKLETIKDCINNANQDFQIELFRWLRNEKRGNPEPNCFSTNEEQEIGAHLADKLQKNIKNLDIIERLPSSLSYTLWIIESYGANGFVKNYLKTIIESDYSRFISIVKKYVNRSWSLETGLPARSDLQIEQYNSLIKYIEEDTVKAVENHFPDSIVLDFPYASDNEKDELIYLKQFMWFHKMAKIKATAQSYTTVPAETTPILETPADYGLAFEDVKYSTEDSIELAAWFIPCEGSEKLIICNHPATLNRYGFAGHKAPWSEFQDIEVTFGKVHKALHDAGYNVLAYDLRNHGESGGTGTRKWGQGFYDEYKDVIATFDYVKSQNHLKDMRIGLFNPCAGGNSALNAMTQRPEYFADVKALVCAQPASINIMSKVALDGMGLGTFYDVFAEEIENTIGIKLDDMTPHKHVTNLQIPTYIVQNKDDVWTIPDDVQTTFDLIPTAEKKLHWIEDGDTRRFIGYNYFGDNPESMIAWFDTYMK